jgi:hypothetical protein
MVVAVQNVEKEDAGFLEIDLIWIHGFPFRD